MFPRSNKQATLARLLVSLALPTAVLSLSIQHRLANQNPQPQPSQIANDNPMVTDNVMSGSAVWSTEDMSRPRFGARHSRPIQRAQSPKDEGAARASEKQRLKVAASFDDAITHHEDSIEDKCDKGSPKLEEEEHEVYEIPVKKVEKHHHHHHHHHHHAKKNKKPAPKEPVQLEIELKGNIKSKKKEPAVQKQQQHKAVKVAAKKVAPKKAKKAEQAPEEPQREQQESDDGNQGGGGQVEDQVSLIGDSSSEGAAAQQATENENSAKIEDRETGGGGHQELMGHEINTSHVPGHDAVAQDEGGGHQVVQEEEAVAAKEPEKAAVKEVKEVKEVKKEAKKKKKKKEAVEVKKVEEQVVKQAEEKKQVVEAEQPKVVVAEPAKVEAPVKEEPKKEEHKKQHQHHSKHAHIELHAHKHFEQHQHINVHPSADLGEGHVENEPPLNHHAPEEVYQEEPIHNHVGDHHQHQHEELEHIAQHHGGGHVGGHGLPLKEEWVAPEIHELPGHKQHVPGAIVIEDHSALEQQPHQPMGLNYKEEVISHPHGFGLTPSGHGYGNLGAYSSPKSTLAVANATLDSSH